MKYGRDEVLNTHKHHILLFFDDGRNIISVRFYRHTLKGLAYKTYKRSSLFGKWCNIFIIYLYQG